MMKNSVVVLIIGLVAWGIVFPTKGMAAIEASDVVASNASPVPAASGSTPTDQPGKSALPAPRRSGTVVFGLIDENAKRAEKIFQNLADHAIKQLSEYPGLKAKVVVAEDVSAMTDLLADHKVDVLLSGMHAWLIFRQQDMDLRPVLARASVFGVQEAAQFIARGDRRDIGSLEDLRGATVALDAVFSTAGHLLPRAHLLKNNYALGYFGEETNDEKAVNLVFYGGYYEVEQALLNGDVDAAVVPFSRFKSYPEDVASDFKAIGRTEAFPAELVSVAGHMDPVLAGKLTEALAGMDEDPEGRLRLSRYQRTSEFAGLPDNFAESVASLSAVCSLELHKEMDDKQRERRDRQLIIGRVSDNPKKHSKRLKAIVEYVAERLGSVGIAEGHYVLYKNNDELIAALKNGDIDWVSETPFSAVLYEQEAGAEIELSRWKKSSGEYASIIFVRKDSGIETLHDLAGRKIAFEDPGSTSAFLVPLATLLRLGLPAVELQNHGQDVPEGKVGYVFTYGELNSTTWVHKKVVDAAALSNEDWVVEEDHVPSQFKKDLKIIYKSPLFPRSVEVFRKDLRPEVKEALKDVLLEADQSLEGQAALEEFNTTTKFQLIDEEVQRGLDEIRLLLQYARDQI